MWAHPRHAQLPCLWSGSKAANKLEGSLLVYCDNYPCWKVDHAQGPQVDRVRGLQRHNVYENTTCGVSQESGFHDLRPMQKDAEGYFSWFTTWNHHCGDVHSIINEVAEAGLSIDALDSFQLTLLAQTAMLGSPAQFRAVLQAGADPKFPVQSDGYLGPCPVLYVFYASDSSTVVPNLEALVEHGASLDDTDEAGETVESLAAELPTEAREQVQAWLSARTDMHPE